MAIPISLRFSFQIDVRDVLCRLQRGRTLRFSSPSPHWRQPALQGQGTATCYREQRPPSRGTKKQKKPKGGGASAMLWAGALSCCRAWTSPEHAPSQ